MTVCDRGGESKIIKNSVTYFMDGPLDIYTLYKSYKNFSQDLCGRVR